MGAFTHLGDRYGPYQPGTSDLADLLRTKSGSQSRRGRRGRASSGDHSGAEEEKSEVEDAMTHVVEAFRFLHARVSSLEAHVSTEDVPLDGAAWLAPARELDGWVEPLTSFVKSRTRQGDVLHADCGEGALIVALTQQGVPAIGVEPRGGVALRALERGCEVSISEVTEHLPQQSTASLGGLVFERRRGPVAAPHDPAAARRLPPCARQRCTHRDRVRAPRSAFARTRPTSQDMVDRAALHLETWELLLDRTGFVDVTPLPAGTGGDQRFGVSATTPTT